MKVSPISYTQPIEQDTAEELLAYCARVSSPDQDNPDYKGLLKYCARHGHWSVFEMADMCVEIETTRAISAQIMRHRSFCFQEFSQRYAKADSGIEHTQARRQDTKNRQNSLDDMSAEDRHWFTMAQSRLYIESIELYDEALDRGIAKECARMLLPLNTKTRLYMKGSIRSWIHYIQVRTDPSTQQEHRQIAEECKKILFQQFPILKEVLG